MQRLASFKRAQLQLALQATKQDVTERDTLRQSTTSLKVHIVPDALQQHFNAIAHPTHQSFS
jgi:hypothetical protein